MDDQGKLPWSYVEDPTIVPSAFKHGLDDDDIRHAYRNALRIWDLGDGFTMVVGPNHAAILLEVDFVRGEHADVIVHAMTAREKFLRR